MKKLLATALLTLSLAIQATTIQSLRTELNTVNQELSKAIKQESEYSGGLIKTLIKSRVEILKINSALIQQRIHAIESGSQIKVHIDAVKPDPIRTKEIEAELFSLMADIRSKEVEAEKYTGGLIKVLLKSGIATLENSVAILKLELIKAKYGITWIPEVNTPDAVYGKSIVNDLNSVINTHVSEPMPHNKDDSYSLIKPVLSNKRFEDEVWDKNIWFDILWLPINLQNDTRAVKGILIFEDIFGEEKFRIRKTINDAVSSESGLMEFGIGFEYNDFKDGHKWVRSTDFKDMKFKFKVEDIIYQEKHSSEKEIKAEEDQESENTQDGILNELKVIYINQIAARVKEHWRYKGAKDSWGCDVHIMQDTQGNVKSVNVQSCSVSNKAKLKSFRDSIERAVNKASPLPSAPDKGVFESEVLFYFRVN